MWLITEIIMALVFAGYLVFGHSQGMLYNFLNFYIIFRVLIEIGLLLFRLYKGQFGIEYWQQNLISHGALFWLQLGIKILFFGLIAVYTLRCLPIDGFSTQEYQVIKMLMLFLPILIIVLNIMPTNRINWPQAALMACVSTFFIKHLWAFERTEFNHAITLVNPFGQTALVVQGGNSSLFNHHFNYHQQQWALDMVLPGRNYMQGQQLTDFPCFGHPLYAPISGEVVALKNDAPDVQIGETDLSQITGNYVVIKQAQSRYVMLAHLKFGSIQVELGQSVLQGDTLLGECGNSGNTTEPHLHLQVQDTADFKSVTQTFPIYFKSSNNNVQFARANSRID